MTFAELNSLHLEYIFKQAVLRKLVEYLDENFLPKDDGNPKVVLLTEDQVRVPTQIFDMVAEELNEKLTKLAAHDASLMTSVVTLNQAPTTEVKQ